MNNALKNGGLPLQWQPVHLSSRRGEETKKFIQVYACIGKYRLRVLCMALRTFTCIAIFK